MINTKRKRKSTKSKVRLRVGQVMSADWMVADDESDNLLESNWLVETVLGSDARLSFPAQTIRYKRSDDDWDEGLGWEVLMEGPVGDKGWDN